ncbi:phage holin [Pullulanibacillus sp. KACC 23026]|uniref:phage holin n=1 Tax=Pullulanibacillus sp. KACC 23026 TaxID=3028315 RepID=UPI0023AEA76D|nr:phage holin [Pullulanibacillus sp. KACC 23026]WEG10791.1 phage holin [Pullulanibacillus sp. KACC 23026]
MKINWSIRFKNGKWVICFVSQILIIIQMIIAGGHSIGLWSFQWTAAINLWVIGLVNAILVFLSLLGLVQDPTVEGFSDTKQVMRYEQPKPTKEDPKVS